MAGMMISCSSLPSKPPSPLWGLRLRTAIFGLSTPKSRSSEDFISRSLLRIFSWVMLPATSFRGMWPVTTPTLSESLTISIVMSLTPKAFCRYSVWPA